MKALLPNFFSTNLLPSWNQIRFGEKNPNFFGAKIWNNLLYHIKSSDNFEVFKNLIENWNENSSEYVLSKKHSFDCCVDEDKVLFL